jgi:two-component system response regulator FlrC
MMTPKILVIDDDEAMVRALSDGLSRSGYSVISTTSCQSGLEIMERELPELIICDLKIEGMDGLQFMRQLKKKGTNIPVVMITAYGNVQNAVEAMKLGAVDFVSKPFTIETIDRVIRSVLKNTSIGCESFEEEDFRFMIVGEHPKLRRIIRLALDVADSKASILIQGESGTGKEILARFIHKNSKRASKPFVAVNCAALPESLLESELFGHEKGAFSGAIRLRKGKFEQANGGTILLDEISEMNPHLQAKLLRVLQEFEVDRLGGSAPIPVDVRVISTTNRDIKKMVQSTQFREDLYYRLNVIPVYLPPLRERKEDIPILVEHFIKKYTRNNGKRGISITDEAIDVLINHCWPGNVRELENVIERAILVCGDGKIKPLHLGIDDALGIDSSRLGGLQVGVKLREMEKALILETLKHMKGNRTHASRVLGISLRTLRNKLREYSREGPIP